VSSRAWFGAIAVLALAAVGAALFTQHVWDMQPCPWCVLQRLIFVAIAIASVLGFVLRSAGAALVALLSAGGAAAALYQHFVAAKSQSCDLTLADRIVSGIGLDKLLPDVFAVRASCADAAVDLFHLPYEFWSLALYALFLAMALRVLVVRKRD
jgi:disulfide bond formation protein DsbB